MLLFKKKSKKNDEVDYELPAAYNFFKKYLLKLFTLSAYLRKLLVDKNLSKFLSN